MKFYKYSLISFLLLLVSCNDYLDKVPDERLTIDNVEKIRGAVIGAYQNDYSYRFTDLCTDNVTLTQNVFTTYPIINDLYSWNRDFKNQTHQDSPSAYWVAAYGSILNANLALEAINSDSFKEEEKAELNLLKGEALIIRAYNHFMLVNIFSKHYDVKTASSDLGIPYVSAPEKELAVDYSRGTVEEVYTLIEKDLLEGLKLIEADISNFKNNKYRFTPATVFAFASRFYTWRNKDAKDIENVIAYSEKSLQAFGGAEVMRPWADYQADDKGPVDIDQSEVGLIQSSYTWTTSGYLYAMTNDINNNFLKPNPFKTSDSRLNINFRRSGDVFHPAFFFVYSSVRGASATDIFPLAEVILNKAEAYVRQADYTKATEMFSFIAKKCYPSYDPTSLTSALLTDYYEVDEAAAWTKYLLHERRVMFIFKGLRWFDIKRYNLDVEHKLESGETILLSKVAPDKDFQIPKFAISNGMTSNK